MTTTTRTHYPRRLANGRVALVNLDTNRADTILAADAPGVFTCTWAYEGPRDEDGWRPILECGAVAYGDDHGFRCEAGHDHVSMETRAAEGWDYVDADEMDAIRAGHFLPTFRPVPA